MNFACVNCSRLTAESFTSDDLIIYKCTTCDMEYQLITGYIENHSASNVSLGDSKAINERGGFDAMPIKVEIKQPSAL